MLTWGKDRLERMTIRKLICMCSFCARMHAQSLSYVRLFVTLWTIRGPMEPPPGFSVLDPGSSRQEYWSELLFSSPGDPPDLGV